MARMIRVHRRGFTLTEALVALVIFGFLVTVFYRVFSAASAYMVQSRLLRGAVSVANERLEQYRNIAYDELGTSVNAPFGAIVPDEVVVVEGVSYRVITTVFYVDDVNDGEAGAGDTLPADYKRVNVTVVWGAAADPGVSADAAQYDAAYASHRVRVVSQFITHSGMETVTGGGTLRVNVMDSEGVALAGMPVTIHNINDGHSVTIRTNALGTVLYAAAPACVSADPCYDISVGKAGYQTITTMPLYDGVSQTYHPKYERQRVLEGGFTASTIVVDAVADVTFACVDGNDAPLSGMRFALSGGRVLGRDVDDSVVFAPIDPVVVNDADHPTTFRTDTTGDGVVTSADRTDPGVYTVAYDGTSGGSDYQLWKITGGATTDADANAVDDTAELTVQPGATHVVRMVMLAKEHDALFVRVRAMHDATAVPIAHATVRVFGEHDGVAFDREVETDAAGEAYLASSEDATLVPGKKYTVTVTADGYREESDSNVKIQQLTTHEVTMTPL